MKVSILVVITICLLAACSTTGNLTSIAQQAVNFDQTIIEQMKVKAQSFAANRDCLSGLIDGASIVSRPSLETQEAIKQATASSNKESDDYRACREYAAFLVYQYHAAKEAIGGISSIVELIR